MTSGRAPAPAPAHPSPVTEGLFDDGHPFGIVRNWPVDHASWEDYDRRLLRGERTRRAIAEAMIDLIDEGNPRPTSRLIAERAGVSIRLLFHHFEDVSALFIDAANVQVARHWSRMVPVSPSRPLAERIDHTCRQRRKLYVGITPLRRSAFSRVHEAPEIAKGLAASQLWLRGQLAHTFAPEIERAGNEGNQLLDALDVAAGWEAWNSLQDGTRTPASARRVMAFALTRLLS